MSPLKILIVGGGIAGPALAFWLARLDCDITILERAPDLRASGQQIDIRGQGLTAMRRMGLEPEVREKVVDEQGARFVDEQGRTKAVFLANKSGKGKQSLTSEFEIMRGDLVRILYDRTKDTCRYLFGLTVDSFEQRGDGVRVRLSDGSEADYDLLVGADGQGSRTRRRLFGGSDNGGSSSGGRPQDSFRFLDLYLSYFTVPRTERDDNYATICLLPRNRVISTRVDNPKTMQVYLAVLDPKGEREGDLGSAAVRAGDVQRCKEVYAELFKDAGWETRRLLDGMLHSPEAKDFYSQTVGQVKIDRWSKGRVVLLGDAAYCASPVSGVGTSLGLVGPYVLAGEIARQLGQRKAGGSGTEAKEDHGEAIDAALASYETVLRPLVDAVQDLPWGVPHIVYAESSWGVWIRNFLLGVISTLRINKLFESFQTDDFGGGWKIPDYPELKYENTSA